MRELKYHEKRLLKKTNFLTWKRDKGHRHAGLVEAFGIEDREDLFKYEKLCGLLKQLLTNLKTLPATDELRLKIGEHLVEKLVRMGVLRHDEGLVGLDRVGTAHFAGRRLAVMLVRKRFVEKIDDAVQLVRTGHIRVGPNLVAEPALHVTREMEDNINWAEGSSMKRKIMEYQNEVDDFVLMGN